MFDNLIIKDVIKSVKKVEKYIDIIEVGIILIVLEGKKVIKVFKEVFLNKIIVVDGKIVDVGKVFGKMFFENGVDFIICICVVELFIIIEIMNIVKEYGVNKEV